MHAGVGVAKSGARLCGNVIFALIPARSGCGAGSYLSNRLVSLEVLEARREGEALYGAVDATRIELVHNFPAEAELVHGARMQVLHEDVGALNELGEDGFAVRGGGIESQRFFIGVELQEVVAGAVGVKLQFLACGVAAARTFDFYHVGTEPCEHLGARRS